MILAVAAMLATVPSNTDLTFVRSPSFDPRDVQVESGVLWVSGQLHFWFKRTVIAKGAKAVWWTDTNRCPASREVLIAVDSLELPKVWTLATAEELVITADGVGYSLKAKSRYPKAGIGDIEVTSNLGTPLANWVDESLRVLESCWSKQPPIER